MKTMKKAAPFASAMLIAVFCLVGTGNAQSQADVRRVITSGTPMTKKLGGGKAGELILNTKVTVKETRGAWSRVTVDGWVRTNALSAPRVATNAAGGTAARRDVPVVEEGALTVKDYVSTHRTDVEPPRQYLMLTIANKGSQAISNWKALLVGQNAEGKILFREPISQDKVKIEPGSTSDVSFFWEPHEELYSVLGALSKDKLNLKLIRVESK